MLFRFLHGDAGGVDGFDGAHGVAFNAGDLDEAADGVAGHAEVVLHGDFGGVLDLSVGAAEGGGETAGGHGAGDADFALAADFGAGDGSVLFVEDADGGGGEEEAEEAGFGGSWDEVGVVVGDGGDDAGRAVGGGGDDATAGGVFFIDGHGVDGDPIEGGEGVGGFLFLLFFAEAGGEAMGAAADVEAAGEDAFGDDAAGDAGLHDAPDFEDAMVDLLRGCLSEGAFVGLHELVDAEGVGVGEVEKFGGAVKWVGDLRVCGGGSGWGCAIFGDEAAADGEEGALDELRAGGVEGGEAEAVGVQRVGLGRVHLVAVEEEVGFFVEGDGLEAGEGEFLCEADVGKGGMHGFGVNGGWLVAAEAEEDGAVGGVADAGQRQGAVEVGLDAGGAGE